MGAAGCVIHRQASHPHEPVAADAPRRQRRKAGHVIKHDTGTGEFIAKLGRFHETRRIMRSRRHRPQHIFQRHLGQRKEASVRLMVVMTMVPPGASIAAIEAAKSRLSVTCSITSEA